MDFFNIGGVSYNVIVTEFEETFTILYSEETGRTLADGAEMYLSPIGTFFGYKVTVSRKAGFEKDFDDLYDYISTPRNSGIKVKLAHNQTTWEFDAYVSTGGRKIKKISQKDNVVIWGDLAINIVPTKAQVLF